nr:retrovirus-related Pol polyprotein from transposon TNT 1-94 [Tanacetum cinerariifolium]
MFDELLNPPPSVDHQAAEVITPIADVIPPVQAESTDSPSSTTVDQDAPSLNVIFSMTMRMLERSRQRGIVFVGYSKESTAFRIYNKRTRKIHERVNMNFDEISEMASKQFSLELVLSKLNETEKSSNQSIMKSPTTNVESSNVEVPLPEEEVFHEILIHFKGNLLHLL